MSLTGNILGTPIWLILAVSFIGVALGLLNILEITTFSLSALRTVLALPALFYLYGSAVAPFYSEKARLGVGPVIALILSLLSLRAMYAYRSPLKTRQIGYIPTGS